MVHQGQGLALGLEPGDDLPGVHAGLDDLEGHLALDRLELLGHEHHPEAAFADLLQQLVAPDDRARAFADELLRRHQDGRSRQLARALMGLEQRVHQLTQLRVRAAGLLDKGHTLPRVVLFQGVGEDFAREPFLFGVHPIQSSAFPVRFVPTIRGKRSTATALGGLDFL